MRYKMSKNVDGGTQLKRVPPHDITMRVVRWAEQHDWYKSCEINASGNIEIWVKEGDETHPWPFLNYQELRNWAGY